MPRFEIGQVVITPGVLDAAERNQMGMGIYLEKHYNGDWGIVDKADGDANDYAVSKGDRRIMSAYRLPDNTLIWIITEWDHETTTILLPEEY